jgi:ribonuclease G
MSKELVVSANRHETRVAVLEDDQVVEVYYQREKEYSLAGSIHKGRVTRVLPGMQSAFVDIGLDRDAFLYVSDFFEDNDEYDKIVTSVEEKVLKMDKGPAAPYVAATLPSPPPAAAVVIAAPPAVRAPEAAAELPATVPQAAAAPHAHEPFPRNNDDRDRRGRRGRRRRPKGRGLPESKFFSPGSRPETISPAPEETVESTDSGESEAVEDLVVLPGELLAKYSHPEEPATQEAPETREALEAPESLETPSPMEAAAEPMEAAAKPIEAVPELEAPPSPAESARDIEPEPDPEPAVEEPEAAPEPPQKDPPEENAPLEAAEDAQGDVLEDPSEENAATALEAIEEPSGPEPARIPTSLTAALREQDPRYLHRVSRRTRRRGRPDGPDFQQRGDRPREPRPQESRPDARADVRPVAPTAPVETARPDKAATVSISDLLREGQEIIVQIAKEPLGQKGARITSHIALPGRFLVYMPTVDHIGVSRKIPSDDERLRLKRVLQANRSGIPGGFIVRTAGDGRTEEELRADMQFLYNLWMDLRQKAEKRPAPALVHHDLDVVERILRDQLTASFKSIWVDNEDVYENVLRFVQRFQPVLVTRVKLYTRTTPIFDEFGVTQEIEKALRPKVWLKTGGHIVINQTEALVAIDVNTGKFVGRSNRLEDTIVKANTDAIKEIVRQIRLRDLGGIIVVDFIDMDERKNRQKVMQTLEEAMRSDRAPYKILQFNDFGLVAITRKRVKQSLERTLCVPCPYCEASGYVKSVQTLIGEILTEAQKIARAVDGNDVTLRVNPEVAKILKSNQNSYLQELEEILGRTVLVKSDPLLHQEKFDLA